VPTLVIHGEEDLVPREAAAHIAAAIPGGRLSILRNCGHFAYLERPGEVHREVTEFLR
jgi:proline iminopeptidase